MLFCEYQVKASDRKHPVCLAHANEDHIFECPFKDLSDAKNRQYPCIDGKPVETKE